MSSLSKVVSLSATDGPTDWPTKQKEKVERGERERRLSYKLELGPWEGGLYRVESDLPSLSPIFVD